MFYIRESDFPDLFPMRLEPSVGLASQIDQPKIKNLNPPKWLIQDALLSMNALLPEAAGKLVY
jgi:hypothetical protein